MTRCRRAASAAIARTNDVRLPGVGAAGSLAPRAAAAAAPSAGGPLPLDGEADGRSGVSGSEDGRRTAEPPPAELAEVWEVIGGLANGGITVRVGEDRSSPKVPGLLSRGARVRAVERIGGRLRYELVSGAGPERGWVSIRFQGKYLLFPAEGGGTLRDAGDRPEEDADEPEDDDALLRQLAPRARAVWRVVGGSTSGGIRVRTAWETSSPALPRLLQCGALVEELDSDAGRLRYQLLEGRGPPSGWVSRSWRGRKLLEKHRPERLAEVRRTPTARAGSSLVCEQEGVEEEEERHTDEESTFSEGSSIGLLGGDWVEVDGTCWCCGCGLPLDGAFAQCRCSDPVLLEDLEEEEAEARRQQEWALKWQLRADFGIGWEGTSASSNQGPLGRLGRELRHPEMCCLMLRGLPASPQLDVAETCESGVAVSLEYLSLALRCGIEAGVEPRFSLDLVDPLDPSSMLLKKLEPALLLGTSVGEVLFQADYYLKELAMGQFEQPVPGMRSCLDFIGDHGLSQPWRARVWFVVLEGGVCLSEDGVLIPHVRMGVEAREQRWDSNEDACVTRPEHPLVRYAAAFTENFDAIAEQVDVVRSLRETAKAYVLARFLLQEKIPLGDGWFDLAAQPKRSRALVPQLWNRCCLSRLSEEQAAFVGDLSDHPEVIVWGGVDLSLSRLPRYRLSQIPVVPVRVRAAEDTDGQPADSTDADGGYHEADVAGGAPPSRARLGRSELRAKVAKATLGGTDPPSWGPSLGAAGRPSRVPPPRRGAGGKGGPSTNPLWWLEPPLERGGSPGALPFPQPKLRFTTAREPPTLGQQLRGRAGGSAFFRMPGLARLGPRWPLPPRGTMQDVVGAAGRFSEAEAQPRRKGKPGKTKKKR